MRLLKALPVLLLWACAPALHAQTTGPDAAETYSRLRITLETPEAMEKLAELGLPVDHGERGPGYFIGEFSGAEIKLMDGKFHYQVLIKDLEKYYEDRIREDLKQNPGLAGLGRFPCNFTTPANFNTGTFGGYLSLSEILAELDEMRALYPGLITVRQPLNGTTAQGRQLFYVRISDNADTDEDEPEALYTGLHHAREPMSAMNLIFFMHYILENYATDPEVQDIVDNTELYFIPCVNPDGYEYNRSTNPNGGGMWRKNRRNNGNGTYGVDLNRNYGFQWGYDNSGSSPTTSSDTYRGPSSFSEAETQMIRDFCLSRQFVTALNDHAYGNYLVLPWGYTNAIPESTLFNSIGDDLNNCNNYLVGNPYATVGYPVNGSSDDWMYGEQAAKGKIYAITPEIGTSSDGFWPAPSKIVSYCNAMMYTNLRMAYYARSLSCTASNIAVTPGPNSATVSWTAGTGSSSYNVRYRQIGAPAWTTLSTGSTSINLLGLAGPCAAYEVQVQSLCAGGVDGQFSSSLNFSTSGDPLPGSWAGLNVGSTGGFGSECYNSGGGSYAVTGGGALSSTNVDGLRFIYATLSGSGSITAKVNSLSPAANNKAGVMIRESLANNARSASSLIVRASSVWRSQFVRRTSTGANASITQPSTTTAPPYWVRITRSGNSFTAYRSSNGTSWTKVGSTTTIAMPGTAYIGLAVASGSTASSATASISNVSTTGAVMARIPGGPLGEQAQALEWSGFEGHAMPRIEVYPNPGTSQIHLKIQLEKPARLNTCLLDMLGGVVLQLPEQEAAAGEAFQLIEAPAGLPAGIYMVRCSADGQQAAIVKWVKR
ncbi:MAG: T9SS type A sorting domain-containing protein [Lewinellaceae bacterium]|nr:T9SS type A sorting domain-containing protein [Phaeodactylibacter sp.]MCB9036137.1 T9SS type A sorting domain-containing protein [Lewinellaceae bacterium]